MSSGVKKVMPITEQFKQAYEQKNAIDLYVPEGFTMDKNATQKVIKLPMLGDQF